MLTNHTSFFVCLAMTIICTTPLKAEKKSIIISDLETSVSNRIESFFIKNPNEDNVLWMPKVNEKSRYIFAIPKVAFRSSKKYKDTADLYYLSKKIDNNLVLYPTKKIFFDITLSDEYLAFKLKKNLFEILDGSIFINNKVSKSVGLGLNKKFILSKNKLGKFNI